MESLKSCDEPRHLADAHSDDSISSRSHERNSDAQLTSKQRPKLDHLDSESLGREVESNI
ncbi:hypothetical protein Syun_027604 [Stephania yunnanensis]|uniref:Uncharacterized protein n=1 Tax=Stephania yunnanensis TaxID=152371 RepID=A0AAP0EN69_9MAGN